METVNGIIPFSSHKGSGPQNESTDITLNAPATQVTVLLTGFTAQYTANDGDHEFGRLEVKVMIPVDGVQGTNVKVEGTYGLRDWSGNWDDKYEGQIFFAVIAE